MLSGTRNTLFLARYLNKKFAEVENIFPPKKMMCSICADIVFSASSFCATTTALLFKEQIWKNQRNGCP